MILITPVEEHHIAGSASRSPQYCALARAIQEHHPDVGQPHVYDHHIVITQPGRRPLPSESTRLSMSTDVRNFVKKHALTTFKPKPFTLVLDTDSLTAYRFDSYSHLKPKGINWWNDAD